jgi:hypothetical protein
VRPGGLLDSRDSFPETSRVSDGVSVDGKRSAERRWQDKGALGLKIDTLYLEGIY